MKSSNKIKNSECDLTHNSKNKICRLKREKTMENKMKIKWKIKRNYLI